MPVNSMLRVTLNEDEAADWKADRLKVEKYFQQEARRQGKNCVQLIGPKGEGLVFFRLGQKKRRTLRWQEALGNV